MSTLLHTVLRRYFRSKTTMLILIAAPVLGIVCGLISYEKIQREFSFDGDTFLYLMIAVMFLVTAGIVLTISSAFSDGIIRLQCIHANSKTQIALAQIISAMLWGIVCGVLFLLPFRFFGNDFFTQHQTCKQMQVFPPLLMMFPVWGALTAVMTLTIRQKAVSSIAGIALLLGLLIGSLSLQFRLDEPKYRRDYETEYNYTDTDSEPIVAQTEKLVPNEWYIHKPRRDYLEFAELIDPLTPVGEIGSYLVNSADDYESADQFNKDLRSIHRARRKFLPWFQCFTILALTAAGTAVFRRRNLK